MNTKFCKEFALLFFVISLNLCAAKPSEEDLGIDEILKEFYDETKTMIQNAIPLNAQGMSKLVKPKNCTCTKFFLCDVDSLADKSKEVEKEDEDDDSDGPDIGLINVRLTPKGEGGCGHYLEICCDKIKPLNASANLGPSPSKQSFSKSNCGKRNYDGVGFRITGGKSREAQFGEFTWMAAITQKSIPQFLDERPVQTFLCGGSLIHPRVVLTAAHCVSNKSANSLKVRLGEWDTQTTNELYQHKDIDIKEVIIHEGYNMKKFLRNDIALAILDEDVDTAPHIGPVCLPSSESIDMSGAKCFASGWGKDRFGQEGLYQAILKKIDLPIVDRDICQKKLQAEKLGPKFRLHGSFVCAGGEPKKDTCEGDGGSPLVCKLPGTNNYFQYGIVSWGLSCGLEVPGVYVNVPHFVTWIEEKLQELGINPK